MTVQYPPAHYPSIDLTDPKVRSAAQGVATRRNNEARRKLENERAKLALFADQLPTADDLPVDTPEQVIERRKLGQAGAWERGSERDIAEVEKITRLRNEIFALVSLEEYESWYARSFDCQWPQWAFWGIALDKVKRRADPMPENASLILAWLENWETEPPTSQELHQACGDGMTWHEVFEALQWLEARDYVLGGVIRPCALCKYGSCVPWRINPLVTAR